MCDTIIIVERSTGSVDFRKFKIMVGFLYMCVFIFILIPDMFEVLTGTVSARAYKLIDTNPSHE